MVYQDLPRISNAVADGSFFANAAYLRAMEACRAQGTALHLMGLLSDGGVHSHIEHLYALLRMAKRQGLEKVYIHAFLDGRDVSPTSGLGFVEETVRHCAEIGVGKIATVMGRYYAMDRDKRWDRLRLAYEALVSGRAPQAESAEAAIAASYEAGVTDEFFRPVMLRGGQTVRPQDSVIFFNFRPDRARELTRALCDDAFDGFSRENGAVKPHFVCFTQYDAAMPHVEVAFRPEILTHVFGEWISRHGLTQLRIAETEKYAHVTFFFNGGEERTFPGEDRVLIPSPKVATYDLQPEMSAFAVAEECVRRIESDRYDVIILNFANCDMVGHTGVFSAAVRAVETVDACVGQVLAAIRRAGGRAIITADHGNAECMEKDGVPFTQHTTNPVPVLLVGGGDAIHDGALCDLAPTMLALLGLPQPPEMTGHSLL